MTDPSLSGVLAPLALDPAPDRRDLLIVVDGLGLLQLEQFAGHARTLRGLRAHTLGARTVAPSSTAPALTSLGTGADPGTHGVLGYETRDPATGRVVNHLDWPSGVDPLAWQRVPTLFERATRPCLHAGRPAFRTSGLTRCAFRGGGFTDVTAHDRARRVARLVARAPQDALVYLHLAELDHAGHGHGPGSAEHLDTLEALDRELGVLLRRLPPGTRVTITADHGMVTADPARRVDLAATALAADHAQIAGEPRLTQVHARDTAPDQGRWQEVLGDAADVLTRDQAVTAGLFGAVSADHRARIGDLVLVARGRATVVDSRHHPDGTRAMPGVHGSTTDEEMLVPLITVAV